MDRRRILSEKELEEIANNIDDLSSIEESESESDEDVIEESSGEFSKLNFISFVGEF